MLLNLTRKQTVGHWSKIQRTDLTVKFNLTRPRFVTAGQILYCDYLRRWEVDTKSTSPKGATVSTRREEGWKEVVRKSSVQTLSTLEPGYVLLYEY